jgi:hypothetical protein
MAKKGHPDDVEPGEDIRRRTDDVEPREVHTERDRGVTHPVTPVDRPADDPRHEARVITPRAAQPAPGWSNSTDTGPQFTTFSPNVDMSIPGFSNNGPASTGATAGIPGAWTPPNSDPPNKFSLMNTITAAPATAWTTGQYVTLGDGSLAHWGGVAWTSGKA